MDTSRTGRCPWAQTEAETAYHDTEWCRPLTDDGKIFELLILEGMQAGLSWRTILNKRQAMSDAFDGFDFVKIAGYSEEKKLELLQNPLIIRNRAKINALVSNARAFIEVRTEYGTFSRFIWKFTGGRQQDHRCERMEDIPCSNDISDAISAELKKRGFKFTGSKICYSLMQAIGMVNDHLITCPEYAVCIKAQ